MENHSMAKEDDQKRTVLSWSDWGTKQKRTIIVGGNKVVIQELDGHEYDEVRNLPKPVPPMEFKKGQDGKPILKNGQAEREPNFQDPDYIRQLEEVEIARTLKILEHGLVEPNGKEIPGKSVKEKWEFLKGGKAGDIDKIALEIIRISNLLPGDVDFLNLS